ncbi:biopolymer transport protein ExbB/TolQ [Rhizobium rosettiformans]|nr:biopolymer transport protein ExbB/TolQ [Rhizobium rosettiformans]
MMNQSALLRPDWTPATVALMVLGFMVFWPLGLAMLAYILFGEKFQNFKRQANRKADTAFAWCRTNSYSTSGSTGNVAFDDWRKAELERLDEERRRLDEMRAEFDTYARELRRAKDQEEFDRFMRDRQQVKTADQSGPTQGFTGN